MCYLYRRANQSLVLLALLDGDWLKVTINRIRRNFELLKLNKVENKLKIKNSFIVIDFNCESQIRFQI